MWLAAGDGTAPASSPVAAGEGTTVTVNADGGANLRDQPTLAREVILLIPQGGDRDGTERPDGCRWLRLAACALRRYQRLGGKCPSRRHGCERQHERR